MNERLDIIVGDFGRPGTLRYLELFSQHERELASTLLSPGERFLDEHRRVQLTVLCQLRYLKRQVLQSYAERDHPLDDSILVGTSTGLPVDTIAEPLVDLLDGQVRVAAGCGARHVRIVIPCNTLGLLADPLQHGLCDRWARHSLDLRVEHMQPLVADALRTRRVRSVRILGTPASVKAYRDELDRGEQPVDVLPNPEELTDAYERCITDAIRGVRPEEAAFALIRDFTDERRSPSVEVLEACTDVSLGVGLDALEIYAECLAREAYPDAHMDASLANN